MLKNIQIYFTVMLFSMHQLTTSIEKKTFQGNSVLDSFQYLSSFSSGTVDRLNGNENQLPEITLCKEETKIISTKIIGLNGYGSKVGFSKPREEDFNAEGQSQEKATTILMEVVPELMKFNLDYFRVTAGKKVILELDNLDGMQHNLLIIKPGTLEKVGAAADAMLRDPKASEKHYVPEIPEVLFATDMLGPNEVFTLNFTAPTQPGDYPFVCTFPGHWRMMNGIMRVVKP